MSNAKVLQVDVSGRPVGFISWRRAVSLLYDGRATSLLDDEDTILRSPSVEMYKPLIIQMPSYVKLRPLKDNQIVKRVLFARDRYECQYCGTSVTRSTGTIDHIKPRDYFVREGRPRSDAHTWDNVVVSCVKCNTHKGNRLPHECKMYPRTAPKKPSYVQTLWAGKVYHPIQADYVADWYKVDPDTLLTYSVDNS